YPRGSAFASSHASGYADNERQVLGMVVEKRISMAVQLLITFDVEVQQMAERKIYLLDLLHRKRLVQCIELLDIFIGQHIVGVAVECFPSVACHVAKRRVCDAVLCFYHSRGVGEAAKLTKIVCGFRLCFGKGLSVSILLL